MPRDDRLHLPGDDVLDEPFVLPAALTAVRGHVVVDIAVADYETMPGG